MTRTLMTRTILGMAILTLGAMAQGVAGKWSGETETPRGKQTVHLTLNGGTPLTGQLAARKEGRGIEIRDGKVDGNSFSFVTQQKTKRGEATVRWEGKVEGDTMTGTRAVEGGKRSVPFTLKRSSAQ